MQREVKAAAWDEGYGGCLTFHMSEGMEGTKINPYRQEAVS